MFELIITMLSEIVFSLRLTRVLEFAAIIVVVMLFSSPSFCGGTLGVGAKLGILSFAKDGNKGKAEE
jgi:hypothetical protein